MTDDVRYTDDALAALTDFLRDAERALDPDEVLQRYCERYPELAGELRAQAGLAMIAPAEAPAELPDVVLVRELGRGGMGVVYEGWQTSLDRPVAVKLSRLSAAREDRERFLRECRTLARLHQTAIVPIHAAGRFGPWLYCVMPLILGATLADLVRRARGVVAAGGTVADLPSLAAQAVRNLPVPGPASPRGRLAPGYFRSAADALVAVADGLEYAHREGIWHLDVKPSNVMMEPTGHCWLIDFGLARRAKRSPVAGAAPPADTSKLRGDLTQHVTDSAGEGRWLSLSYAAPERWHGRADARSDVWGLGATLYELLTLCRAFTGPDDAAVAALVAQGEPPAPRQLVPGVPRDLQAVCCMALAKRPEDRYQTPGEFADDLRRWAAGVETRADPRGWAARFGLWVRRNRPWAAAAAVCALAAILVLAVLWRNAVAATEAKIAREKLLIEAESHARSKVHSLLELARDRLRQPTAGRRDEVRSILLAAAAERNKLPDDPARPLIDAALRSLYVESLSLLDEAPVADADQVDVPAGPFVEGQAAVHPSGDRMALAAPARPVVWVRGGPKPRFDPADRDRPRPHVAYSPRGTYLAEWPPAEAGGGLRVWDRDATRTLHEPIPPKEAGGVVLAVGFAPDESRLWAVRADGRVVSWALPDFAAGPAWELADRPAGPVTAAAFDRGAERLAVGDRDGNVVAADRAGKTLLRVAVRPAAQAESLAWAPAADRLAIGTRDGVVHLFRADGALLFRAPVFSSGVGRLVFTPDGRWLTVFFRYQPSKVLDAFTGQLVLHGLFPPADFTPDGRVAAAAGPNVAAFVEWRYPEGLDRLSGHAFTVERLAWSPGGRRLATLDTSFTVRLWEPGRRDSAVASFVGPPATGEYWARQGAVAVGADGDRVAYASSGRHSSRAVVWDVATRAKVAEWDLPGGFEQLAARPGGRFLSVREERRRDSRLVDTVARELEVGKPLPTGRVVRPSLAGDEGLFLGHALSPDGSLYVWSGPRYPATGRRVEVRDVASGRLVTRLPVPDDPTASDPFVRLAADRRQLFVNYYEGRRVLRYDLGSAEPPVEVPLRPLAATGPGGWMVFERPPDDYHLGRHLSLRRWPGGDPWVDFALPEHAAPSGDTVHFSPDGRSLAWGGSSGVVTVADLPLLERRVAEFERAAAGAR